MTKVLALVLLVAPLPAAAQTDTGAIHESLRVARVVRGDVYGESSRLRPLIQSRNAIHAELQRLVHLPSPDMSEIERLRARAQELNLKIMAVTYQATDQALSKLSEEERLSYFRSEYPQPVQIITRP
jgi:uncharacterized sporulation protein YeaH/YhbH (DUF444 family)